MPSSERDAVTALQLNEAEESLLFEITDSAFQGEATHQVSGFQNPLQGDEMELECQLATNGLYCGDPSCYEDPRIERLKPGARNWRLLFQIDTDEELDLAWGDDGAIYFWVEEHAAREGNFQNTWLILQCG